MVFDWKSQAFPGYKPVRENFLTKIVDVHWPSKKPGITISVFLIAHYGVGTVGNLFCSPAVRVAPKGIFNTYMPTLNYTPLIFDFNPAGVTASATEFSYDPWVIGPGAFPRHVEQSGPSNTAPFTLHGFRTVHGLDCYITNESGLGGPGLQGMDWEEVDFDTGTITANAPASFTTGGRRYELVGYEFSGGQGIPVGGSTGFVVTVTYKDAGAA